LDKLNVLKNILNEYKKVAIGLSGGVDSTFLLTVAVDTLGIENCLAVIVDSAVNNIDDINQAVKFCTDRNINYVKADYDVFTIPGFAMNPKDRCYICKMQIFSSIITIAKSRGISFVADGSNADDDNDYRPGMRAIKELNVVSPLKTAGLTKTEIRSYSKDLGLATHDKPSAPCYATRFPYGSEITIDRINMIAAAEKFLKSKGFSQVRVRLHSVNDSYIIGIIELAPEEKEKVCDTSLMTDISLELEKIGFDYVTLDLKGYKMGNLNRF
jgi:uncharacterized protein